MSATSVQIDAGWLADRVRRGAGEPRAAELRVLLLPTSHGVRAVFDLLIDGVYVVPVEERWWSAAALRNAVDVAIERWERASR